MCPGFQYDVCRLSNILLRAPSVKRRRSFETRAGSSAHPVGFRAERLVEADRALGAEEADRARF